ncbi:MAG: SxtJ family membrane protein [Candidatus Omnitrophota bacterium]
MNWTKMERLDPGKNTLKKFGVTMGVAFLVISGLFLFRQKYTVAIYGLAVSCAFFMTGSLLPALLKPVYIIWMRFAFILGWINTRIILIIIFYLVFTPVGLLMRLLRIDPLQRRDKRATYWEEKEKIDFNISNYERRF